MQQKMPWEEDWSNPAMGYPTITSQRDPRQVSREDQAAALAAEAAQRAREKAARDAIEFGERNKPNLPAGYMMGPDGQAVRIPGLPPEKGAVLNPQQQQGMAALANDEIIAAIAKARADLGRTGSAGFAARLPEMLQPQSAIDLGGSLNTIASRLTLDKLQQLKSASPTGASGLGALTEKEAGLLRDGVAALGQTQSPERLLENLAAVEKHYRNYMALTAGEDYRNPRVAAKYGIASLPDNQIGGVALANGRTNEEADPALKGVNNRIRTLIGSGAPTAEIVSYMNTVQPGLGDAKQADVDAVVKFRSQNPNVPLSRYPISVENRQIPLSDLRQTINGVAQSPTGSYFANAADALALGTIDNMTENPALARAGLSAIQNENPIASTLGMLSGGALAAAGGEFAAARLGAGAAAPFVGDAAYGLAYGAGSADEGSRLEGAFTGALLGGVGGAAGRRVASAGGAALRGIRDPSVQYLRNAGVPMTVGQMAGNSGVVGRFLKGREDRLSGFSGVGDQINLRRRAGIEGFNRAAYDEGLAPIGGSVATTGEQAVEDAGRAVGRAYDNALDNVRLTPDTQFAAEMGPVGYRAANLPGERGEQALYTLNERIGSSMTPQGPIVSPAGVTSINNGAQMTGRNFQQSVRGLEQDARGVRTETYGADFGNITRDARGALEGMLDRQAPGALPDYLNANAAYRNHSILADATASAMNAGGLFTPAQLGSAARQNARTFTGRISAATTDRPFYDLQRAGQQILPSRVPDSGTAGRAEAGNGILGLARGTARALTNAPLYAESTQPILARLLLDRPDRFLQAGEGLANQRRLLGMFGAPIALNYGPGSPNY